MKRFLYIVSVLLVSLLLVLGMLGAVLMSDRVETSAVQLVTAEFSRALGTRARVGTIEYRFPARMRIRDIYIEDLQRDTLLYVGEMYAHFSPLALRHDEIRFSHVLLQEVTANVYRLPDSTWNYQFLADAFRSNREERTDASDGILAIQDVLLDRIRLRYEDHRLQLEHAQMDLHHLSDDLLDAEITDLSMRLQRFDGNRLPFEVEDMKAHIILNDSMLRAPTLQAQLPHSRLDLSGVEVRFPAQDTIYLSRSAHEIYFALQFNEAHLVPADIALFAPRLCGFKRSVGLSGALSGPLDSLAFTDMEVRYDNRTVLEGDILALGLPDIDNPYLRANLTGVHTNATQIQDVLSQLYNRPIRLPKETHRLGAIHYRGLAEGRLHDLTLHGAFRTALGTITTDGTFRADSLFEQMDYDARVVGRKLRLGKLLGHAPLGTATVDIRSKGTIRNAVAQGEVKANVRDLIYNGYTYNDLHINGVFQPQLYQGQLAINDPCLDLLFDGVVNVGEVNPEINFNLRCRNCDLSPVLEKLPLRTRFALAVDMNGARPDEISGYMVLDSLFLASPRDSALMQQLTLLVSADTERYKSMTMQSDFGKAQVDGRFRYEDIVPALQAMLHYYLPSAVPTPRHAWMPVEMRVKADGERLRDFQRLFTAPITLSDHPSLYAEADLASNKKPSLNVRFFAPGIRAGNKPVHDLTAMLNTVDSGLSLAVSAEAMKMQMELSALAAADSLLTHLTVNQRSDGSELLPEGWQNLSSKELIHVLSDDLSNRERVQVLLAAQRAGSYGGDIRTTTRFSRYNHRPLVDLHVLPSTLMLRDSLYRLSESRVTYCAADTTVAIEHFSFEGAGQHIRAHGLASRHDRDTLCVDLKRVDASYVVPFLLPVQTIMFNGLLTGEVYATSVLRRPQMETQIHVDSMGLNNTRFGDAEVDLHIKDSLLFHADVYNRPDHKLVNLDGMAALDKTGVWRLEMQADSVPLAFVNHWTSAVLYDIDGTATGSVIVGGDLSIGAYVLVKAQAQEASLTLPWTGVRYTIPADTIIMDTTAILFPNVHLVDAEKNPVELAGGLYHKEFRNFMLDLHVDAHDALVFDRVDTGDPIQGHVYGTGHVDITGDQLDILVAADAVTSRNSRFRLSLDKASTAYESSFVHFVEHPGTDSLHMNLKEEHDLDNIDIDETRNDVFTLANLERSSRCLLKLNIEINPQLLFQLVLGERNGDMIAGRGAGALQLSFDTESSDLHLLGTYDIDQGTLSYTVANMIRKEFTVGEGSKIIFSGDAKDPQLDVTAKYRVTANLRDLFGEEAEQLATTRSNIPVLTCLHMTGSLRNPILAFSLEFPQSDQAIQQQVKQVINTDEMLMRQVIYLLVFGRFFTPDYMANAEMATLNSTYSLLSSTVTSQINAWLSKLTNMLTLGVAIRTDGQGAGSSQEYEAQFQIQPVDRLIINGNVGYRYNDMISNQPFFGDLDIEVLLTKDGQWRLKGYTHTVDKYSLRQASTIQGVGVVWKKDF